MSQRVSEVLVDALALFGTGDGLRGPRRLASSHFTLPPTRALTRPSNSTDAFMSSYRTFLYQERPSRRLYALTTLGSSCQTREDRNRGAPVTGLAHVLNATQNV